MNGTGKHFSRYPILASLRLGESYSVCLEAHNTGGRRGWKGGTHDTGRVTGARDYAAFSARRMIRRRVRDLPVSTS